MTNLHVTEHGNSSAPVVVLLSSIGTTHEAWACLLYTSPSPRD